MALRRQKHTLANDDIDKISAAALGELEAYRITEENLIKTRFSLEEALLRMQEHFGQEAEIELSIGRRAGRQIIEVKLRGNAYNPLRFGASNFEEWNQLLAYADYQPDYRYTNGVNVIRWSISVGRHHPAASVAAAIVAGLLLGLAGRSFGAASTQLMPVLEAIEEVWIRLLNVLCGPVIFLLIVTTVLNLDSISRQGGSSVRFLGRVFKVGFASASVAIMTSLLIYPDIITADFKQAGSDFVYLLLQIIPKDVIQPFAESNSPQLLLIAFITGTAIVASGRRSKEIAGLVREANNLGLLITGWMSSAAPFFIFVFLTYEIIKGNTAIYTGMWIPLLLIMVVSVLIMASYTLVTADREKVPVRILLKKLIGPFIRTITEGSADSVYDETLQNCHSRLGIETRFAEAVLSVGLVLLMPLSAAEFLVFSIYAAGVNNASISVTWFIIAGVTAVAMSIATPPVQGVAILTFVVLFSQLGIPRETLIAAMIFDVLIGVIITAENQFAVQLEMILDADSMAMLDHSVLEKE